MATQRHHGSRGIGAGEPHTAGWQAIGSKDTPRDRPRTGAQGWRSPTGSPCAPARTCLPERRSRLLTERARPVHTPRPPRRGRRRERSRAGPARPPEGQSPGSGRSVRLVAPRAGRSRPGTRGASKPVPGRDPRERRTHCRFSRPRRRRQGGPSGSGRPGRGRNGRAGLALPGRPAPAGWAGQAPSPPRASLSPKEHAGHAARELDGNGTGEAHVIRLGSPARRTATHGTSWRVRHRGTRTILRASPPGRRREAPGAPERVINADRAATVAPRSHGPPIVVWEQGQVGAFPAGDVVDRTRPGAPGITARWAARPCLMAPMVAVRPRCGGGSSRPARSGRRWSSSRDMPRRSLRGCGPRSSTT